MTVTPNGPFWNVVHGQPEAMDPCSGGRLADPGCAHGAADGGHDGVGQAPTACQLASSEPQSSPYPLSTRL
jgi:hypothetical protein